MTRIDIEHARRRAKDLLREARAGHLDALARLPRKHEPVILADAQLAIARELGFSSWPRLVASVGWIRAQHDDVVWSRIRRTTFVPFIEYSDDVVIPEDGLPSDEIRPGEDALVDTALRVPLEQAGFRRQGTHVFALGESGTHVAIWIDGYRYTGRRPHRRDSQWWTGDPRHIDDPLVQLAAEARRSLTHEQRLTEMRPILDVTYLSADTPQGGSGFSGTLEEWTANHAHIVQAVEHDGAFLDVGCANGFLLECMAQWCEALGIGLEPYGVDVSPLLVERARQRLPQWADRLWVGDALTWRSPRTFDVVHGLLDTVMPPQLPALVANLLTFVAPGGRLVLSQYSPVRTAMAVVERLGYPIEGGTELGVWLRRPK